jgi:sulfur carrier protein
MISLFVNGERRAYTAPLSCARLIEELGLAGKRIALELNGEIVPRGQHAAQSLADGDKVEIVVAVGGG